MFPDPLVVGIIRIEPMGLAWALGFLIALWLAISRAKEQRISKTLVINLCIVLVFSAFIGAKLGFLAINFSSIVRHPAKILDRGILGNSSLGAGILTIFTAFIYLRRRTSNVWQMLDVISPSGAVVVAVGRLGCFLSGCCYGNPTNGPIGVVFALGSPAGQKFPGSAVFPTQLFEAALGLLLIIVTISIDKKKRFFGETFCSIIFIYSLGRFAIDFYRYYDAQKVLLQIGSLVIVLNQFVCLLLSFGAVALFFKLKKQGKTH